MLQLGLCYSSGYVQVSTGNRYQERLTLIKDLIRKSTSLTEESFNCLALEILRSIYDDAYIYSFRLPLGSVRSKISIYCPAHDVKIICSYYDHVVPIKYPMRKYALAIECPRCVTENSSYY